MNDDQDALLRLITNTVFMNEKTWAEKGAQSSAHDFNCYYANGGINKYSITYNWVHNNDPGNFEYLAFRAKDILEVLKKEQSEYLKNFEKLVDYINLEISRYDNIKELKEQSFNAQKSLQEVEKIASQFEKEKNQLKEELWEEKKSASIQSVTVLSIFTGIVMSFFGGFKLFEVAVGNMTTQNDYKLIFLISFIGFVFFNIIFVLLFASSKISNSSVHLDCKYGKCRDECGNILCERNKKKYYIKHTFSICGIFGRLIHRYTYILVIDAVIVIVMMVSGIFYYAN